MRNIFKSKLSITVSAVVLTLLILINIIIGLLFFNNTFDNFPKVEILMGGLITGLFVSIVQFLMSWNSFRADERMNHLRIISVLPNRDDRTFYTKYLQTATTSIDIMGTTAKRFFEHFADEENHASKNSKVLFNRLDKGVKVRILLPQKKFIGPERQNDVDAVNSILVRLSKKYSNLNYKYFSHQANHNIFRVDDVSIIGPTFSKVSSKNTPGIHIKNTSPLAQKYLMHFNEEWVKGEMEV